MISVELNNLIKQYSNIKFNPQNILLTKDCHKIYVNNYNSKQKIVI